MKKLFKNIISAHSRHKRRKKEASKHARTSIHVCHFPDLPCGEITIEITSIVKHCTTAATTKKSPRIKMGGEKKGESIISKKELVLPQKEQGK